MFISHWAVFLAVLFLPTFVWRYKDFKTYKFILYLSAVENLARTSAGRWSVQSTLLCSNNQANTIVIITSRLLYNNGLAAKCIK